MQPNQGILKRFYPVILLTLVILASVILLSFTNAYASEEIKKQELEQMRGQLAAMFPDMTSFTEANGIFTIKAGDKTAGYAFIAVGKGYGGAIQILVGLEDASTVKTISIISQSETSGLGSRVTLPTFTSRFDGKNVSDVKLKSEGGAIDGFTGSTISSRAVVNAVRETALEKVAELPK